MPTKSLLFSLSPIIHILFNEHNNFGRASGPARTGSAHGSSRAALKQAGVADPTGMMPLCQCRLGTTIISHTLTFLMKYLISILEKIK